MNVETHLLDCTQTMGRLAEQVLADVETHEEIFDGEKRLLIVFCRVLDTLFTDGDGFAILQYGQWQAFGIVFAFHAAKAGNSGEQGARIRMFRIGKDLPDRTFLDLFTLPHHNDIIGHLCHHAHIVGDEDHAHAELSSAGRA